MSLSRRGFLGALAATVAAPMALFAKRGAAVDASRRAVFFDEKTVELAYGRGKKERFAKERMHPIGTEVRNAVKWSVEHSGVRRSFDLEQSATKKLLEWGESNRMRLVPGSIRFGSERYGCRRYVAATFIQE